MRNIILTREKKINGAGASYYVYIDGRNCGNIDNGRTVSIPIDFNQHGIKICADMGDGKHWSGEYIIPRGSYDLQYRICTKIRLLSVEVYIEKFS